MLRGNSQPAATLLVAANGHVHLCFEKTSPLFALWLKFKLQFIRGFRRESRRAASQDAIIVPDFVRGNVRLRAGWDIWSGLYLLSESAAGDDFLRAFAKKWLPPGHAGL